MTNKLIISLNGWITEIKNIHDLAKCSQNPTTTTTITKIWATDLMKVIRCIPGVKDLRNSNGRLYIFFLIVYICATSHIVCRPTHFLL